MKKLTSILLLLIVFISCEKDDFCTQNPVTPSLVIKFMNYNKLTDIKKSDSLYVWAKDKDSIYLNKSLDSVSLPLNTNALSTIYNLSKGKDSISQLTISYENSTEYVSRSCGFRSTYKNVTISKTTAKKSWIDSLSVNKISTINNQTNAHLIIYH